VFANRFTALIDACSLASTLKRNLLLTLAEAEFFRVRWSAQILDETERAIARMAMAKGYADAAQRGAHARTAMERAFEDAAVGDFEPLLGACARLPDPGDAHVLAAAMKTQAAMIVTENLRDFPAEVLGPLNIEAKSADAFLADTINLDVGRAVAALRIMRERFSRPALTPDELLLKMEAEGLSETVDVLRAHSQSL
jgi:predicted nucleic acid-binding protein